MNLKEYTGNLNNYSELEQKKILNTFANELILDMNASMRQEEINHMQSRLHEQVNTGTSIKNLRKIHFEIISNFKKYSPLCYASIVTASKNLKDG